MNGVDRKRRQADRDVFGALGRAVANPLAGLRDNGLAGFYMSRSAFVLDYHFARQHQREFLEIGALAWLGPSGGTAHVRDAGMRIAGIDAANVFIEDLSLRNGNAGWSFDQSRHLLVS